MTDITGSESKVKTRGLLFAAAVLLLAAFDALAGWCFNQPTVGRPNRYYHHGLKPGYDGVDYWGGVSYPLKTNSLGLKDAVNRTVAAQSPRRRIMFLGDSFTEGIGCAYEQTFVGQFAASLDPGQYEIFNGGVRSYSPALYHLRLNHLLVNEQVRIDDLFVFIDLADVHDEIVYREFKPGDWLAGERAVAFIVRNFYLGGRLVTALTPAVRQAWPFKREHLSRIAYYDPVKFYNIKPYWDFNQDIFELWGREGLELSRIHMDKLLALCQAHQIRLHLAIYPWIEHIVSGTTESRYVHYWENYAREKNINMINLFPEFVNTGDPDTVVAACFISRDIHWNQNGHRLIADRLHRYWREINADTAAL